jgi:hypothetical protein
MRALDRGKLIVFLGGALISSAFADPNPANSGSSNSNGPPASPSNSQSGSGSSNLYYQPSVDKSGAPNDHGEGVVGAPVSGPQRHEKVFEVDSLQKLPSSGVDSKFKGSLLDNSIDSIQSLNPNAKKNNQPADPRFQSKELKITRDIDADRSKKSDSKPVRAEADSRPSATPSATASPTAKTSGEPNKR